MFARHVVCAMAREAARGYPELCPDAFRVIRLNAARCEGDTSSLIRRSLCGVTLKGQASEPGLTIKAKGSPSQSLEGLIYRVFHRTIIISIPEPSHGRQMGKIFRSQSIRKQSYRKYWIQSSCLLLKLVVDLTRSQTCPFSLISRMDQRLIVLALHLKGLSVHAIHDDPHAPLGPKTKAYSRVSCDLTFVRPSSSVPKSLSILNYDHLT
jgi:hypothetical protein